MNHFLDVTFLNQSEKNPEKNSWVLSYQLFDNDFCRRWYELMERTTSKPYTITENGSFYGPSLFSYEEIICQMKNCITTINNYLVYTELPFERIIQVPHIGQDGRNLDLLHSRFEELTNSGALDDDSTPNEVVEALTFLNILIHRSEGFVHNGQGVKVDINLQKFRSAPFKDEDYLLFTPDETFGLVYLGYGITGVPVLSSYLCQSEGRPRPQSVYTNGFFLNFEPDKKFDRFEDLGRWLREKHDWDISNPQLALGYIPLGRIRTAYSSREEILGNIKQFMHVQSVRVWRGREYNDG